VIVLLQDVQTGRYLSDDGQWVMRPAEAHNFFTSVAAYGAGRTKSSGAFRVVFHFPDVGYSINVLEGKGSASIGGVGASGAIAEQVPPPAPA
jgi:hypothetical protein